MRNSDSPILLPIIAGIIALILWIWDTEPAARQEAVALRLLESPSASPSPAVAAAPTSILFLFESGPLEEFVVKFTQERR